MLKCEFCKKEFAEDSEIWVKITAHKIIIHGEAVNE